MATGSSNSQLTPMMAQYRRIKSGLPHDALLLFRLGDFYEMFYEDAKTGAHVLNLALTKRNGVPMCGIPHHSASVYIGKLLKAGYKVAICDQLEEARPGKLVKRDVTQILSPGAHFDERLLAAEQNNFLAAVCPGPRRRESSGVPPEIRAHGTCASTTYGIALVDLTTGEFRATEVEGSTALLGELERMRPAEIIYPSEAAELRAVLTGASSPTEATAITHAEAPASKASAHGWFVTGYEDWAFAPDTAFYALREHFKVTTLDGFGLKDKQAAVCAAGAALHYLTQQLRRDVRHLTRIAFYQRSDFMMLDYTTLKHLEVLDPLHHDAPRNASLFGVLNHTVTPMGARRLRAWLAQPLAAVEPIRRRQDVVQAFVEDTAALDEFRQALREVRDLERTIGRLSTGNCNARDLVALRFALEQVPNLKGVLKRLGKNSTAAELIKATQKQNAAPPLLKELESQLVELPELAALIARAIVDDPPLSLKEGGIIRDGYSPELDELRAAMRSGKDWIAKLQQQEIERTGIQSLKIRFNSVFGYYIEVTKANLHKVPSNYIRKQTIAGGERFVTPELKEMENKILGAEERSFKLEYDLFQRVRESVLEQLAALQQTADALAQLDVLATFAHVARLHNYCRPQVGNEGIIWIRDGRHPVLEQTLVGERFVPNDAALASAAVEPLNETPCAGREKLALPQIALITGPNMAGKSTYIRQVALIVLLAHTGSFVPATEARIDLVDRIFTRIGAADDIARGQSTFMVEMTETANILNNATPHSLVILDEIGRGTSTFDGLALAWSIVE
ncbi:MAG: DNA mismatch repair protein MutS, partial [Verrucomicrobiae bacterium]|nr:DNA mismatch repair protein MutS [Verrucomicrobiae bacterium]